jgi:hypothetical protein
MGDVAQPPPPGNIGDHPGGGFYWSAERPAPHAPDDDRTYDTVSGDAIRFMWDYGVEVPLWSEEGLLPEDPEWLRDALGLSDPLIRDLSAWGRAMNALDGDPRLRSNQAHAELDLRARELVERLRLEIGGRFTVTYLPW